MLDYISWYLVELERRLRRKRSARATTDLLIETRAHLEEHASELVAKGMDKVMAERMAVAEFGDPQSVANAVLGHGFLSRRTLGILSVAFAICGFGLVVAPLYGMINPNSSPVLTKALLALPCIAIAAMAWTGFRTGRWLSIVASVILIGLSGLTSLWITSKIQLFNLAGDTLYVYEPDRANQIENRSAWLTQARSEFAKVQEWRADRKSPLADQKLSKIIEASGSFFAPVAVSSNGDRKLIQPFQRQIPSFFPTYGMKFNMNRYDQFKFAKEVWSNNGDPYAKYLKKEIAAVEKEQLALTSIVPTPWSMRWDHIGKWQLTLGTALSMILIVVNGLSKIFGELLNRTRRNRWRKQVG